MDIHFLSEPDFKNPIMVAAWPGMGYLAKISADYLRKSLDASLFAEVEYYNNVLVYKKGLCELAPIKHKFYSIQSENLIVCIGDAQPSTPKESLHLGECILQVAQKYQVQRIYTMAAFPNDFFHEPKVYGIYTDESLRPLLEERDVTILEEEGVVNGLNGVIIGLAKRMGIQGVCLMGDIRYANIPQHLSSKAVLERLVDILGIQIDMNLLDERAEKVDASIQQELERHQKDGVEGDEEKLGYIS
ncbi:MAG: PAC2 family protein [Candidatus Bathyarchaeia archaeon]